MITNALHMLRAAAEPKSIMPDEEKRERWEKLLRFFAEPKRVRNPSDGRVFLVHQQPRPYAGPKLCINIQLEGNVDRSVNFRMDRTYYNDLWIHASYDSKLNKAPHYDFGAMARVNDAALHDPRQFLIEAVRHVEAVPNHRFALRDETEV